MAGHVDCRIPHDRPLGRRLSSRSAVRPRNALRVCRRREAETVMATGTGTMGFGAGPMQEGVVVNPADALLAQNPDLSMAQDIHAIKERYVLPPGLFSVQVNLAQNAA